MTKTADLISELAAQAQPAKAIASPAIWILRLLGVLALYAFAAQFFLGLRGDLLIQFTRPLFAVEILFLLLLLISSSVAAVFAMYPDAYQKPQFLKLPYAAFLLLASLLTSQLALPHDVRMVMPLPSAHAMECAICIAAVALVPAAIIFVLLRKGASVCQFEAGSFAVLAASAIGCLTLRLAEENDSVQHLLLWHYIPTFIFAAIGAMIGKCLLKW